VRDGEVVYQRGYGCAQLEYSIPITAATVFHVASVSKQFTAMAIELLAQDGKLSWDDEVHRYPARAPRLRPPITLRHLANHTSGLRDQWELLAMAGWRLDDVITREHILAWCSASASSTSRPAPAPLLQLRLHAAGRDRVRASPARPLREVAEERIFPPLGMSRTPVHDDLEEIVPGRAYSYAPRDGGGFRNSVLSLLQRRRHQPVHHGPDLTRCCATSRPARSAARRHRSLEPVRARLGQDHRLTRWDRARQYRGPSLARTAVGRRLPQLRALAARAPARRGGARQPLLVRRRRPRRRPWSTR
jgi:CubicO group peptidase (beta-lactamase class C family)